MNTDAGSLIYHASMYVVICFPLGCGSPRQAFEVQGPLCSTTAAATMMTVTASTAMTVILATVATAMTVMTVTTATAMTLMTVTAATAMTVTAVTAATAMTMMTVRGATAMTVMTVTAATAMTVMTVTAATVVTIESHRFGYPARGIKSLRYQFTLHRLLNGTRVWFRIAVLQIDSPVR